jgi:hypothetical protein
MTVPLLTIHNNHAPACGDPPIASNAAHAYVGYFENAYGEQWIFTYDAGNGTGSLRGGDIGWNSPQFVRDGAALGLQLNRDETAWLQACWNSAVARHNR